MAQDQQAINILYVSEFAHIGGGEMSLLATLRNIDGKRFRASVISYEDGPFVDRVKDLGVKVSVFRKRSLFSSFSMIRRLLRYIREEGIDIVHVNSFDIRAALAARFAAVSLIGHLRVIFPFTWRDRLFVRLAKKIVAVSNAVVDAFCTAYPDCRNAFIVMPNGVDFPSGLSPTPLRDEFNLPAGAKLIAAIGRMDPVKGFECLIEAASGIIAEMSDAYFFIVGEADEGDRQAKAYLEGLRRRAAELGLGKRLFFTGFRDDSLSFIAALDIAVIPSHTIIKRGQKVAEGFGRVAVEAMVAGVPVVASDSGGLKEIVEDGVTGLIVPQEDIEALRSAIMKILRDDDLRKRMGRDGRRRFESLFTIGRYISALEALYEDIFSKRLS